MSFVRSEPSWPVRDEPYRRRSPGPRRRDGRNRSRSPQNIDRYQPRGRGGAEAGRRDDYRRRSPQPGASIDRYIPGQTPMVPVSNPLPNPLSLDYQVGFTWVADWWRKDQEVKEEKERQKRGERRLPPRVKGEQEVKEEREQEREKIQEAYDDYKSKYQAQIGRNFVTSHKDQEWFKEKYDPEVRDPFRLRQAEYRRGNYAQWESDLSSGMFDEFSLEGIYKNDSNGTGGTIEKEEGEAAAANEILGVGDLLPGKGGDLRDESALQPALLIKTIAPYVSREKLELFCKDNIGEGEGGFKWLSLSEPNPTKKCHRIGWVMLHPGGDRVVENTVERGDGRDEEGEDGEMELSETKTGVAFALEAIDGKSIEDEVKGSFTCHVGIHVPPAATRKKALWDLFSAPERVERDLELVTNLVTKLETELGEEINAISRIEERVNNIRARGLLEPPANGEKPVKIFGEDDGEEEEGAWDEEADDADQLAQKKRLDLLVEYLRRVHNFCFYCVYECDSVHELTRKCPGGHLRRPRASLTSSAVAVARASANGDGFPLAKKGENGEATEENDKRFNKNSKTHQQLQRAFNWVKTFEDKISQVLDPDSADIKKLGGKPLEEGVDDELKKFVKQEDESKFRCKVPDCTKLFKGENFWRKHVEKRHVEWYNAIRKNIELVNNYVLDPSHVAPGNFRENPQMPNMPTGTPRGFNLAGMPPMPYPGMMPPAFANFGQYPIALPAPLPGYGMPGMMPGQPGPMRRGGGRFGNRAPGPYDRPRNPRVAPPPRGPPRFADAIGGNGAAPKEAVAGRSLKSYEDLDAVRGAGDGELDY